jgi:hypothetical protein
VNAGDSATFVLSGRIASGAAAALDGPGVVYASMAPPAASRAGVPVAFAAVLLVAVVLRGDRRKLVPVIVILLLAWQLGCGGGGHARGTASKQEVIDVAAHDVAGQLNFAGLPVPLGTVSRR